MRALTAASGMQALVTDLSGELVVGWPPRLLSEKDAAKIREILRPTTRD